MSNNTELALDGKNPIHIRMPIRSMAFTLQNRINDFWEHTNLHKFPGKAIRGSALNWVNDYIALSSVYLLIIIICTILIKLKHRRIAWFSHEWL